VTIMMFRYVSIAMVTLCFAVFIASAQVSGLDDPDILGDPIDEDPTLTPRYVLASGSTNEINPFNDSLDFGFVGSCIIGGRLWIDEIENDTENENGIQDEDLNTSGISGVEMTLKMNLNGNWIPVRKNITAKGTGKYIFEDLFEGEYIVKIGDPKKSPDIPKGPGLYWPRKFYQDNNFSYPEKYDCNNPHDIIFLFENNCTKNRNIDFGFRLYDQKSS